ncbi:MAG: hypothetical protein ACI8QZ_000159 [Chlamydiales bacterium]|jgi:hypothetical protein
MHPRLKRQLKSHFGERDIPEELAPLFESVCQAYEEADREQLAASGGPEQAASRAVLTSAPPAARTDQILLIDENGMIVECKGGEPGTLCFKSEESVGKKFAELSLIEGAACTMQAIERCRISAVVSAQRSSPRRFRQRATGASRPLRRASSRRATPAFTTGFVGRATGGTWFRIRSDSHEQRRLTHSVDRTGHATRSCR